MFDRSKPKIGCLSSITRRWTHSSPFDVQKNDVRVCSMKRLLGTMSVHSKPKFRCSSLIINRWTRPILFNVWKMVFQFVPCSKNGVQPITTYSKTSVSSHIFLSIYWDFTLSIIQFWICLNFVSIAVFTHSHRNYISSQTDKLESYFFSVRENCYFISIFLALYVCGLPTEQTVS